MPRQPLKLRIDRGDLVEETETGRLPADDEAHVPAVPVLSRFQGEVRQRGRVDNRAGRRFSAVLLGDISPHQRNAWAVQ